MLHCHKNNADQWLESTNLALQEGLDFKSIELITSALEFTRVCNGIQKHKALSNRENT